MHDARFENSEWYLALGLAERARCANGNRPVPASASARTRFEQWRSQRPFANGNWLSLRLAADGLDLAALEDTLAFSAADLKARTSRPDWLVHIEDAFAHGAGATRDTIAFLDEDNATAGFLNLVGPLLESARGQLRSALGPLAGQPPIDIARTTEQLVSILARRVLYSIERTLVLELHIAKLEGRLEGNTPEARFDHFVRSLAAHEEAASMLSRYPVLARRLAESIDDAVVASAEFAQRLVEDWTMIRASLFAGGDPGLLLDVAQAGDPHRRGRRVVIATFESGARLVYKPRPLDVDVHFQQFLAFINERLDGPQFRTMAVIARPGYGWLEFIDAKPCHSSDEARCYHWRLGGLLAVLHALRGVDCHFENLIAHGDQPVLVDLETIVHPAIPYREPERHDRRFAGRLLTRSVLRVGLLPVPTGGADPAGGIDLSGVASVEGVMSPDRVLQWEKRGTDDMRAVRERVEMSGANNRPHLDGRPLDAKEFRDEIASGFAAVYRLIARERDALLAPGGPVAAFTADPVRVVLRATRAYGLLLSESLHPDLLRDALDRDRFFDRLWVGVDERPALARVVHAEHRDLSRGDIPYFTCRPDSRDLWTSDGERIADFFDRPSLDLVHERIRAMNPGDLARQQWMVTLALGSLARYRDETVARPPGPGSAHEIDRTAMRRSMIEEAARIGDRLGEIAEWDGDDVAWVALEFREQRWFLEPVSIDLYVGLPGVALFLGYLARTSRIMDLPRSDGRRVLARSAARTLLRVTAESDLESIGAFSGWGGVLYACAHLVALGQDVELRALCDRIVQRIDELADRDEDIDVIGGLAGAIGTLCTAHAAHASERALAVAVRCAERLLARAVREQKGLWWRTRLSHVPQTGFSHGNSGIAWALLTLGDVAGDERFRRAGHATIAMEREVLRAARDRAGESSHDVRPSVGEGSITASWCYGMPGLGLARIRALRSAERAGDMSHDDRRVLRAELEQLVLTTLDHGFVDNHCLCHGDLGTLDFLIQSRAVIPGLEARIDEAAAHVLDDILRNGPRCGTPEHVPSPGMMNGLAGIGYGLLRLADPDCVPSLLALDPPYSRASVPVE
jgi:type 2 lantibiotic biosynthesis protein LanM